LTHNRRTLLCEELIFRVERNYGGPGFFTHTMGPSKSELRLDVNDASDRGDEESLAIEPGLRFCGGAIDD